MLFFGPLCVRKRNHQWLESERGGKDLIVLTQFNICKSNVDPYLEFVGIVDYGYGFFKEVGERGRLQPWPPPKFSQNLVVAEWDEGFHTEQILLVQGLRAE